MIFLINSYDKTCLVKASSEEEAEKLVRDFAVNSFEEDLVWKNGNTQITDEGESRVLWFRFD